MKPRFNERKATQIAALIIQMRGAGKISHLKLMKLMYLVDRKALLDWGWSLTWDSYASMPNGMTLSGTLNLLNEETFPVSYWKEHISAPEKYEVHLLKTPDLDELSEAEIALIEQVFAEYGHRNRWYLVDEIHHKLPEWIDPGRSSLRMDYGEVLKRVGKSELETFETISGLEELAVIENLAL